MRFYDSVLLKAILNLAVHHTIRYICVSLSTGSSMCSQFTVLVIIFTATSHKAQLFVQVEWGGKGISGTVLIDTSFGCMCSQLPMNYS